MTQTNWTRRRFMTTAASAAGLAAMPRLSAATDESWQAGRLEHLLPAASHRMPNCVFEMDQSSNI